MRWTHNPLVTLAFIIATAMPLFAQPAPGVPAHTREEDVIYGRKFGTALTLDVFTPKENANGLGLIFVVSGGWFSSHDNINVGFVSEFLNRGYTVFAVVHGSQPKFTIPEILQDMHRAVRYIRAKAAGFKIDPNKLGIFGGSAGGHLSLMQGTAGAAGNATARDLVDRESSRVAAVACFFPPTDFLNYGSGGIDALKSDTLKPFRPPFDFHELNREVNRFERITDEPKLRELAQQISPISHITPDDPPMLIIHGDADKLVPIQQSQTFIDKLKAAGVPCELIVRPGAAHGWPTMPADLKLFADWFDKYLKK